MRYDHLLLYLKRRYVYLYLLRRKKFRLQRLTVDVQNSCNKEITCEIDYTSITLHTRDVIYQNNLV